MIDGLIDLLMDGLMDWWIDDGLMLKKSLFTKQWTFDESRSDFVTPEKLKTEKTNKERTSKSKSGAIEIGNFPNDAEHDIGGHDGASGEKKEDEHQSAKEIKIFQRIWKRGGHKARLLPHEPHDVEENGGCFDNQKRQHTSDKFLSLGILVEWKYAPDQRQC